MGWQKLCNCQPLHLLSSLLSLFLGYVPLSIKKQLFGVIILGPVRGDGMMCLKCHTVSSERFFQLGTSLKLGPPQACRPRMWLGGFSCSDRGLSGNCGLGHWGRTVLHCCGSVKS